MGKNKILGMNTTFREEIETSWDSDYYDKISTYLKKSLGINTDELYIEVIIEDEYELVVYVSDDYSTILDTGISVLDIANIVDEMIKGDMERDYFLQELSEVSKGVSSKDINTLIPARHKANWLLLNQDKHID